MQKDSFHKKTKAYANKTKAIITTIFVVIVVAIVGRIEFATFNDHEYIITVTDKDRIYRDGDSKYLVFGEIEDGKSLVFQNTDEILRLKWNSSDIQGELRIGKTYEITVIGYRIPITSAYENIIKIKEVQ